MIDILYDSKKKLPDNVTIIDCVNVYVNNTAQNSKSEKHNQSKKEVKKNGK